MQLTHAVRRGALVLGAGCGGVFFVGTAVRYNKEMQTIDRLILNPEYYIVLDMQWPIVRNRGFETFKNSLTLDMINYIFF